MNQKTKRRVLLCTAIILFLLFVEVATKNQIKIYCTYIGENDDNFYFKEYIITKDTCVLRSGYENDVDSFEKETFTVDAKKYNAFLKYLIDDKHFFSEMKKGNAYANIYTEIEVEYGRRKKRVYLGVDEELNAKLDCFMEEITGAEAWV